MPFGEALRHAGPRATDWLDEMGGQWLVDLVGEIPPPSETFETASKVTPARVIVQLRDGREFRRELDIPVGAVGSPTRDTIANWSKTSSWLPAGAGKWPAVRRTGNVSAPELATLLDAALTLP